MYSHPYHLSRQHPPPKSKLTAHIAHNHYSVKLRQVRTVAGNGIVWGFVTVQSVAGSVVYVCMRACVCVRACECVCVSVECECLCVCA